jgi:hypothetical protein
MLSKLALSSKKIHAHTQPRQRMKAQPAPLATAILAPAPLTVLVTCTASSIPVSPGENRGIEMVVSTFLEKIQADGSWTVQVRTNPAAKRHKHQTPGSLKIKGKMNGQQVTAFVTTPCGSKWDLVIVGPMKADEVLIRSNQFEDRIFILNEEPRRENVIDMPKPIDVDDIILFLSAIISDGGTVLVRDLGELTTGLGGDNLVEHCVKEGFLQKDGTRAYSITPKGEAFVPCSTEQPPAQQKVSVRISDILEQVTAARETLAERDGLAKQLETLTHTQQRHEAGKREGEKRQGILQRQLDEIQRQMSGVHSTIEDHRRQVLAVEATMREVTEQLRSHKFTEAASVIGDLQELQDALK